MTDEPDNLVLRYLRRIDERLERVEADLRDLKGRMTLVEERLGYLEVAIAHQSARIDRIEDRLARIERRLDLVTEPVG
jgi:glutathione S-transferase